MSIYIVRFSNVLSWVVFFLYISLGAHMVVTGAEKFSRERLVKCEELLSDKYSIKDMEIWPDLKLDSFLLCADGGDSIFYEKVETLESLNSWLLNYLIFSMPIIFLAILNYLLSGKLRLLPWRPIEIGVLSSDAKTNDNPQAKHHRIP